MSNRRASDFVNPFIPRSCPGFTVSFKPLSGSRNHAPRNLQVLSLIADRKADCDLSEAKERQEQDWDCKAVRRPDGRDGYCQIRQGLADFAEDSPRCDKTETGAFSVACSRGRCRLP